MVWFRKNSGMADAVLILLGSILFPVGFALPLVDPPEEGAHSNESELNHVQSTSLSPQGQKLHSQ